MLISLSLLASCVGERPNPFTDLEYRRAPQDAGPPVDNVTLAEQPTPEGVDAAPAALDEPIVPPADAGRPSPTPPPTSTGNASPSACVLGEFSPPVELDQLGIANPAFGPTLSSDALTIIFSAIEGTDEDLFRSTRPDRNSPFGPAEAIGELNDPTTLEGTPYLTAGDLALYFFSNRDAAVDDRNIWVARRSDTDSPFLSPVLVEGINSPGLEHLPWVSQDETRILLVADRTAATAGSNIWTSSRADAEAPFPPPAEVIGVNADARDEGPFLTENELSLYLASNRADSAGMDLWVAKRSASDNDFGEPERIEAVSGPSEDIDPTLSTDETELFFSSDRNGAAALYRSVRECL